MTEARINKYVSRYVVPFYFEYENKGYERICRYYEKNSFSPESLGLPKEGKWINVGFWENCKTEKKSQPEMDVYSYLPSIFIEDKSNKDKMVRSLGDSFVFKTDEPLLKMQYLYGNNTIPVELTDLGVLIMRNGIGFVWYEAAFKDNVTLEEYVGFQHDFKELARTRNKRIRRVCLNDDNEEVVFEPFCLGIWLSTNVFPYDPEIRFWAEIKTKMEGRVIKIPDRALLYQYLFIGESNTQERNNLVFRIANGYDKKYNVLGDVDKQLYMPFENISYCVSKSGMACVVTNTDTNEIYFKNQFGGRYIRDYFFIYLLLCYQSYSCAHYSRLLTKMPADAELFNGKGKYLDKLESLNSQINLFMVKSVFGSVSNVQHQNGVYRYGKNELCVEEDIQSLTVGLGALREMERDKRDRKTDKGLALFGSIIVVTSLIDGLNLVDWFMDHSGSLNYGHFGISAVIIGLTVFLFKSLFGNRK